jgi:hypothetical protein
MNNIDKELSAGRYSSRYNRQAIKMVIYHSSKEAENYVAQFYNSKNYQERLEAIKYLIGVHQKYDFPRSIFTDALKDYCSQVKIYVLKNHNFSLENDPETEQCLVEIAKNDEKVQLRALAMERLTELNAENYYDLFFAASLLKSSKESAAGLRGLYYLDKAKAYQMAKFRAETSNGELDLIIAEIFLTEGNADDFNFFRARIQSRNKFHKMDLVRIYLRALGRSKTENLIKNHIRFICSDISNIGNKDLVQILIMELHHFVADNKDFLAGEPDLSIFLNTTIDLLLEKDYAKIKKDPFGPI